MMCFAAPYIAKEKEWVVLTGEKSRAFTVDELKGLQLYLDGEFVLYRLLSKNAERRAGSKVVTSSGVTYESISFKNGTPGIITRISDDRQILIVSFESGCELDFVIRHNAFRLCKNKCNELDDYINSEQEMEYCGTVYR